jgi:hypothetical protein
MQKNLGLHRFVLQIIVQVAQEKTETVNYHIPAFIINLPEVQNQKSYKMFSN